MIYKQQLQFELGKDELFKRTLNYFKINNYRIRRAHDDTLIAENTLPYTIHRHPLRFISFYEVRLSGDDKSSVMELTSDYGNLRKFVRRILRLSLIVILLPLILLIARVAMTIQSYGEDSTQVWLIMLVNFCIGLIVLGFVAIFSHKKFSKLQKLLVFGSNEQPDLNLKIGRYFKELLQGCKGEE